MFLLKVLSYSFSCFGCLLFTDFPFFFIFLFSYFLDVFRSGVWASLNDMREPSLTGLTSRLQSTDIPSRAPDVDLSSEDGLQHSVEFDFSSFVLGSCDDFNFETTSSGVKGRLSTSFEFWKNTLHAPEFVLDTVRRGYRLPFAEYPPSCFFG